MKQRLRKPQMESGFLHPLLSSFSAETQWILGDSSIHTDRQGSFVVTALSFVTVKLSPVNKDWGPDTYSDVTHDSGCDMGHVMCFPNLDTR